MNRRRAWYNLRIGVSVFLSIASTISFANFYLDLGYLGKLARGILLGIGLIGLFYALFLTPSNSEFREHGWWWKEGN